MTGLTVPTPLTAPARSADSLTDHDWARLGRAAWDVCRNAVARNTSVGAAVLSSDGNVFVGCNVEHKLRCHDVHAEVNALSNMIAAGDRLAVAIFVVSEGRQLTPCGSCMDWIIELGGPACAVAWQGARDQQITPMRADELMPHYPR